MSFFQIIALAVAILIFEAVFYAVPAEAYIGPALASVAYLLAPIAAVLGAAGIVLFRPMKSLIKWCRGNEKRENPESSKQSTE